MKSKNCVKYYGSTKMDKLSFESSIAKLANYELNKVFWRCGFFIKCIRYYVHIISIYLYE